MHTPSFHSIPHLLTPPLPPPPLNTQVSERNYNTINAECPIAVQKSGVGMSSKCTAALKQMDDSLGGMFG